MLLQWTIVYGELVSQARETRTDAFADPLDSREWEGFRWIVKWFEKSAERRAEARGGVRGAARRTKRATAAPRSDVPAFAGSCGLHSAESRHVPDK